MIKECSTCHYCQWNRLYHEYVCENENSPEYNTEIDWLDGVCDGWASDEEEKQMTEYVDKQKVINKLPDKQTIKLIRDMEPADVIEIPDNATNGDVIRIVFPSATFMVDEGMDEQGVRYSYVYTDNFDSFSVDLDWWNAPYRKGDQ